MADTPEDRPDESLAERFLDLVVFLPTGLAVTIADELPKLAERGRERLGVQVNSARAVGKFAVTAGGHQLRRRSARRSRPAAPDRTSPEARTPGGSTSGTPAPPRLRSIPRPPTTPSSTAAAGSVVTTPPGTTGPPTAASSAAPVAPQTPARETPGAAPTTMAPASEPATVRTASARQARPAGANVPDVTSLAIPAFDTLSASQVVQRLDGLSRSELVAVRAYETSSRGRRTILSRVDQLLDERS